MSREQQLHVMNWINIFTKFCDAKYLIISYGNKLFAEEKIEKLNFANRTTKTAEKYRNK